MYIRKLFWSTQHLTKTCFNPLMPKISIVILLTAHHMDLVMLVWRIWYWIN